MFRLRAAWSGVNFKELEATMGPRMEVKDLGDKALLFDNVGMRTLDGARASFELQFGHMSDFAQDRALNHFVCAAVFGKAIKSVSIAQSNEPGSKVAGMRLSHRTSAGH